MAIDRGNFEKWQDDDGTGTVGTRLSKRVVARDLLDPIDAAIKAAASQPGPPAKHAASHAEHGPDPITVTPAQVTGLDTLLAQKCGTSDARLTDVRRPAGHAASHAEGGRDAITVTQKQVTGLTTALHTLTTRLEEAVIQTGVDPGDPRLTNARTPLQHAATHGARGSDPILISSLGGYPADGSVFLNGNGAWVGMDMKPKAVPWTPMLNGVQAEGVYCQIGPLVFFQAQASKVPTGDGSVVIDALPVPTAYQHIPLNTQWANGRLMVNGFYFV